MGLIGVDDEALPAVVSVDEGDTLRLVGGGILLEEDGAFLQGYHLERSSGPGGIFHSAAGRWSLDEDRLRLAIPPNPGVGDSLVLFWSYDDGRLLNDETSWGQLVYERIDE